MAECIFIYPWFYQSELNLRLDVKKAVLLLAEKYRSVLYFYYYEGETFEELGKRFGITVGSAKWRVKRALGILRHPAFGLRDYYKQPHTNRSLIRVDI